MPLAKRKRSPWAVLLALLLLLLLAALLVWLFYPEQLAATPATCGGRVGGEVKLKFTKSGLFGKRRRNRPYVGNGPRSVRGRVRPGDRRRSPERIRQYGPSRPDGRRGGRRFRGVAAAWLVKTPPAKPPEKVAVVPPHPDAPVEVAILSDQGQTVHFPVGGEFDDFRVEARYRDGMTRLVTKKAALRTPEPPQDAPLAAQRRQADRRAARSDFGHRGVRRRAVEDPVRGRGFRGR